MLPHAYNNRQLIIENRWRKEMIKNFNFMIIFSWVLPVEQLQTVIGLLLYLRSLLPAVRVIHHRRILPRWWQIRGRLEITSTEFVNMVSSSPFPPKKRKKSPKLFHQCFVLILILLCFEQINSYIFWINLSINFSSIEEIRVSLCRECVNWIVDDRSVRTISNYKSWGKMI